MSYEKRPLTGALFSNDKKVAGSNQPDFQGDLTLDVTLLQNLIKLAQANQPITLRVGGWKKTTAAGKVYLSLAPSALRPPQQSQAFSPPPQQREELPVSDDEIPF